MRCFYAYLLQLKRIVSVSEIGKVTIPVMPEKLVGSVLGVDQLCRMAHKKES